jgi:hypothetical protein
MRYSCARTVVPMAVNLPQNTFKSQRLDAHSISSFKVTSSQPESLDVGAKTAYTRKSFVVDEEERG